MNVQVWLCLGICLVILPPILSFLSSFYRNYIRNAAPTGANTTNLNLVNRTSIVNFVSILHNSSFLLSNITYQGN
jgi:hypothetical protein